MKKLLVFVVTIHLSLLTFSQAKETNCYPTHWWVGMNWNKVQVMMVGKDIATKDSLAMMSYPGVTISKINKVENPNYLFVDLEISSDAKPGTVVFYKTSPGSNQMKHPVYFSLKERRSGKGRTYAQGVTSKDFIYLIMPDRFSNGDETNDRVAGMRDQSLRRDTVFNRHGGDLKGIQNHLDYIDDLGVTAIWLNPVWENDMPNRTEHGYAFTNHYKVDPRAWRKHSLPVINRRSACQRTEGHPGCRIQSCRKISSYRARPTHERLVAPMGFIYQYTL